MTYVYEPAAYGREPVADCFWTTTQTVPDLEQVEGDINTDIAIIGAGFTGISASYHLAKAGVQVALVDAHYPTFGATGRNGGFCCLGGGKITNRQLEKRYGISERALYRKTEVAAVTNAKSLIDALELDVDVHSNGETIMAHTPKHAASFVGDYDTIARDYGISPIIHSQGELDVLGMNGAFHGGMTIPIGFALNPRKYAVGLLSAAMARGAKIFCQSPVAQIRPNGDGYILQTPRGNIRAKRFIIATNAYSSETLIPWMRARFMPVQSSVIVTEPLNQDAINAQGWTSEQMAYDTRFLLHYFRKMPDGRFLFGMRGGLRFTPTSERSIRALIQRNFDNLFPTWRGVQIDHYWSGLVAMNRSFAPYVGPIPGYDGGYAAFGYHGNGVAMASYVGGIVADLAQDRDTDRHYPAVFRDRPKRFPFGRQRRWLMAPIYRVMGALDG
jgi:glycine/D-amino acid oxidase-like deaminating enzyme